MAPFTRDPDVRRNLRRRFSELGHELNFPERVGRFFRETIWDEPRAPTRAHRWLYSRLRVLALAFWNFQAHGAATLAAALTYTTLLAVVPVVAVSFSLFQVFGGIEGTQERLEAILVQYIAPGMEDTLSTRLREFAENMRHGAGANAALGTVLLFITVIRTLSTLEETFNRIAGAKRGRGWGSRVTVYWAAATLGPVLLGVGLAMTAAVSSSAFVAWLDQNAPWVTTVYRFAPALLTCAAFGGLYLFLPNVRIKPHAALVGGLAAGIAFEVAKRAFTAASKGMFQSYNQVYGGIATIFVFLLWVYISWTIVLIGLEIVVAVQSATTHRKEELAERVSQKMREMIALRAMVEVSERFHEGAPPPSIEKLAAALDLPERLIADILTVLEAQGLVREVEEADEQFSYVPARTIEKITVGDVIEALREEGATGLRVREDEETRYLDAVVGKTAEACASVLGAETMKVVAERLIAQRRASPEPAGAEAA